MNAAAQASDQAVRYGNAAAAILQGAATRLWGIFFPWIQMWNWNSREITEQEQTKFGLEVVVASLNSRHQGGSGWQPTAKVSCVADTVITSISNASRRRMETAAIASPTEEDCAG